MRARGIDSLFLELPWNVFRRTLRRGREDERFRLREKGMLARKWCFTLNNWTDEEKTKIHDTKCRYLVCGRESRKTGTPHLQGFVYFKDAHSMAATKVALGCDRVHLERANGTVEQNEKYCTKEDDDAFTKGVAPQQGKRSDISTVREYLKDGGNMRGVLEFCTSYQSAKFGELWLKYLEPARTGKPEVEWYWGLTGVGKSKAAAEKQPDSFWVNANAKWWCGMDNHEEVIWDDFRPSQIVFRDLLRIIDRYPVRVEVKGGQRQCRFSKIIFTGTKHPKDVYDVGDERVDQLIRRIDKITHFTKL